MDGKHTPGEWVYKDGEDVAVRTQDNALVALVYSNGTGSMKSNARLIAAAPDLLRVCETAMDMLQTWSVEDMEDDGVLRLVHQISAAIAKAEGRE